MTGKTWQITYGNVPCRAELKTMRSCWRASWQKEATGWPQVRSQASHPHAGLRAIRPRRGCTNNRKLR